MDPTPVGTTFDLEVVLPVHQEEETVEATVREWLDQAARTGLRTQVVVSEDGSTDGTRAIVERLATEMAVRLVHHPTRLGYSEGVRRGLLSTTAPLVCCADGDGQCDPADLPRLLERLAPGRVVAGIRSPRADPVARRVMSASFGVVYRVLHGIHLADPSCPFVLAEGELFRSLAATPAVLDQGYWWEFHVRARRRGVEVVEVPVGHRVRAGGSTRVYRPLRLVPLGAAHLAGLWRLRRGG